MRFSTVKIGFFFHAELNLTLTTSVFLLPDWLKYVSDSRVLMSAFPSEFVAMMGSQQVRTRLRVNRLGWTQKSQEFFFYEERARNNLRERGVEMESEGEGERERREGKARMTSSVFWWHEAEWEERLGEKKGDKLSKKED